MARHGRMQQPQHLRPLLEPPRDLKPRAVVSFEPHCQCAQSAKAEINVVGADAQAAQPHVVLEVADGPGVGRNRSDHHVGVAADIFGAGLDREINAEIKRPVIERARPGIVHQHNRALGMGGVGDGGNILHLETQRARRFEKHGTGVLAHERCNRGPGEGIEIRRGHAIAGQDLVTKTARRPVHAISDEDMVAGVNYRQQCRRNSRKTRWQQRYARALRSFELLQRDFERLGRWRAAAAILIARAMGEEILSARIEHSRRMIDRRINEAIIRCRVPPGVNHAGILVPDRGRAGLLSLFHRLRLSCISR